MKIKEHFIVSGIILIVIIALIGYGYKTFFKFDKFLPGVRIASVVLRGLDAREATVKTEEWFEASGNAPVTFYSDDYSYRIGLKELCVKPDIAQLVGEVWELERKRGIKSKFLSMNGSQTVNYPMKITYEPEIIQTMVEEMGNALNRDFENAGLEVDSQDGLKIVAGRPGQKVDVDATFAGMPSQWEDFTALEVPIVLKKTEPVVDEEQLKVMGELAAYTTWYNVGEVDRSHNLVLAAQAINSTAISPGEEFSFNRTVGERSYARGYRDALIINNGLFEPGLGGGICQVSSTIYNAALLAGMDITERHNHALAVTYVPLSRDATITYGIQDFRFKNNTTYPIYIRSVAGGGGLTVNIYGHLDFKQDISLSHVVDQVFNFEEFTEMRDDLAPGMEKIERKGQTGYRSRAFRNYLDKNGRVTKTEQLSSDYYKPVNKIIFIGPTVLIPEEELLGEGIPLDGPTPDIGPEGYLENVDLDISPGDQTMIDDGVQ